jgi:flagellar biosynthesis anti-sigma factor FlgM
MFGMEVGVKINNNIGPSVQNLNTDSLKNTKSDSAKDSKSKMAAEFSGSASLNISPTAKSRIEEFNKIKAAAISSPDVREEKIERLRNLIDSGNYKIDAETIADRMVDEHAADAVMAMKE